MSRRPPAGESAPHAAAGSGLPDYDHPPLTQVTLGVALATPVETPDLSVALAQRLGPAWQPASTEEDDPPSPAASFHSVLGDYRLAVDPERLEFTWDGSGGEAYPHYETVRDGFVVAWVAWCDVLQAGGATPLAREWSVAYLNRLPQGTVWRDLAQCDCFRLLPPVDVAAGAATLEDVSARWEFQLPEWRTRLSLEWSHTAGEAGDPRACLWLRLACRGAAPPTDSGVFDGLDYGRRTIVSWFQRLMSPAANAYWGRQTP